jgi:hypothetical protein
MQSVYVRYQQLMFHVQLAAAGSCRQRECNWSNILHLRTWQQSIGRLCIWQNANNHRADLNT